MTVDPLLVAIDRGVQLLNAGDRDAARRVLVELWDGVGADGDALHRCALAHALADAQDDPADELAWDLRALDAAGEVTDARTAQAGMTGGAAGLFPSLHLNLADVYRRLGDARRAAAHVVRGRASAAALGDDGYVTMIRDALDRVVAAVGADQGSDR